jgi:hypothetical protein
MHRNARLTPQGRLLLCQRTRAVIPALTVPIGGTMITAIPSAVLVGVEGTSYSPSPGKESPTETSGILSNRSSVPLRHDG